MITIKWGNDEKTIMRYEFEGKWSIADLTDALDSGVEVANRYDHPIDVVVDLTNSGWPDVFGQNVNKAFKGAIDHSEDKLAEAKQESGLVVIVTQNPIIRSSLSSLLSIYPAIGNSKMLVANTMDDARNKIASFREREAVA